MDAGASLTDKSFKDKTQSNTQIAAQSIKQMIIGNQLPAGSNHLESELALKLGMSRTPVREALLILEAQGLLEVRPRKGVKILALSIDDMREIYQILTEIEGLSVQLAAENNHDHEELSVAGRAIADMDHALSKNNREDWALADGVFHNELVRLGGNSRAMSIFNMYTDQVSRVRALTLYLRPLPTKSNVDHDRVLHAIRNGDGVEACEIHRLHRIQSGKLLIDLLEKHKLRLV